MKSKDIIIALAIILIVLLVGLYFVVRKSEVQKKLPTCTAYACTN